MKHISVGLWLTSRLKSSSILLQKWQIWSSSRSQQHQRYTFAWNKQARWFLEKAIQFDGRGDGLVVSAKELRHRGYLPCGILSNQECVILAKRKEKLLDISLCT